MKKWYSIIALTCLLTTLGAGQSHEPFTGTQQDMHGVQKWIRAGGQFNASASIQRDGSGNGAPLYPGDSAGFYGHAIFDTATGSAAQAEYVVKQKSGTNNVKEIVLFRDDNTTFASGGGVVLQAQYQTGNDNIYLRHYSVNYGTAGSTLGYPGAGTGAPSSGTKLLTTEINIGDTLYLRYWDNTGTDNDRYTGGIRRAGGAHDSLTFLTSEFTASALTMVSNALGSSGRFGIGGAIRTTPNKWDDFRILTPGAAAPPPAPPAAVDTVPPVVTAFAATPNSALINALVSFTGTVTDNFGAKLAILDTSSSSTMSSGVGQYDNVTINTGSPVLSFTWTTKTLTSTTARTLYARLRVQQDTGTGVQWDTSAIVSVVWINPSGGSASTLKRGAYMTTWDIHMGSGTNGNSGPMPVDSIPFNSFDYFITFAINWNAPGTLPASNGNWVTSRQRPLNDKYHAAGKPVLLCIGNTASNFTSYAFGANEQAAVSYLMRVIIDSLQYDGIDLNAEGSFNTADYESFAKRLYDSLQTRTNAFTWTGKPLLTAASQTGNAQGAMFANIDQYFDMIHLMSYDKLADWNCMVWHESGIYSYLPGSSTNFAVSNLYGGNCNGNPNYMQTVQHFFRTQSARPGAIPSKYSLMLDVDGAAWRGGTFADGQGAMWPRRVWTSTPTLWWGPSLSGNGGNSGSDWKFYNLYGNQYQFFLDSLRWDDSAKVPFISKNPTGSANDEFISFTVCPQKDSALYWIKKLATDEGAGGVSIWAASETYFGTSAYPAASWPGIHRGWFGHSMNKYFQGDTTTPVLAAPTSFTPANGATNVAVNPTLDWNDVGGASKYWVQFGVATVPSSFAPTVDDSTLMVSQRAVTAGAGVAYMYRVRTRNANAVWGPWSNYITFATVSVAPSAPTLISPANAAVNQPQSVTLVWSRVSTAVNYILEVDDDSNFSSKILTDSSMSTNDTTRLVTGLAAADTFYWRVRSKNSGGYSSFTGTFSFRTVTATAPAPPSLTVPPHFAQNVDTVNRLFAWSTPTGATSYRFQLNTLPGFDPLTSVKDTVTSNNVYVTSALQGNKLYYWRVAAINSAGQGGFSTANLFVTTTPQSIVLPMGPDYTAYRVVPGIGWTGVGPIQQWDMAYGDTALAYLVVPADSNTVAVGWGGVAGKRIPTPNNRMSWYSLLNGGVGGGGTMTGPQIADSLAADTVSNLVVDSLRVLNHLRLIRPGADPGTDKGVTIVPNPSQSAEANATLTAPPRSGEIATTTGANMSMRTGEFTDAPLGQSSGGFGVKPSDAQALGFPNSLWGYRGFGWELFPADGLSALFQLVSFSGITGNKVPIYDGATGTITWKDTTGLFEAGSGTNLYDTTEDTVKANVHLRSFTDTVIIWLYDETGAIRGSIRATNEGIEFLTNNTTNAQGAIGNSDKSTRLQWVGNNGFEEIIAATNNSAAKRLHRDRWTATNSDPFRDKIAWRGATTTATPTVLAQLSFDTSATGISDYSADGSTYIVDWTVIGSRTDADGYAAYTRRIVYRNNAGTVSEIQEDVIGTDVESNANTSASFGVSGDYGQVTITGDTSQNWTWHIHATVIGVNN